MRVVRYSTGRRRLLAALAALPVLAPLTYLYLLGSLAGLRVRFSTTTSLYSTGLLDYLAQAYRRRVKNNIHIDYVPVGTGAALRLARDGNVDGVFVHAPNLEARYIESGVLEYHRIIAYNYFCVVGPHSDPAGVARASTVIDAFRRTWEAGERGLARFVSRGDNSGTHIRERVIWSLAGLEPNPERNKWYLETGQGMAETLLIANNLGAYTLSDTGTFYKLKLEGRLPSLALLYTGDPLLLNIYSAYLVRGRRGTAEYRAARNFIDFIVANPRLIDDYTGGVGRRLFEAARKEELGWLRRAWEAMARGEWGRLYDIVPRRGER